MADSILKLKVESSEYDAKLKKAAEGIRHLADVAHKGGGDLTGLEKAELDYIKALGDMETKSRTASGQVRELANTYKELTVVYNNLNDVEKSDEGGKALAASLETLKQRAQEAKAQLDTATQSLNDNGEAGKGTSSVMEMLKDKFTVNIDAVKLFNIGLQAAEAALNVAKDAFFNNEEQLDEWGRVVESSHSLYTGFLNALNTGDISGYLSNINQIVQAARDAYDAMDELATYNAFNQRNVQRARTGMTESIVDFREGTGSKEDVKAAGEAYKKELRDRQKKEYEAYYKKIGELALTRGVDKEGLTAVLEGTYDEYKKKKGIQQTGRSQRYMPGLPGMPGRYEEFSFSQGKLEKMAEALRNLNDTELQSVQAIGAQADRTGDEIAQVDKQLTRVLNGRQPGASGGTTTTRTTKVGSSTQTEMQKNQAEIAKLTQEYVRLGDSETEASRQRQAEIQKEIQLLEKRNGLLKLREEQAHGRLLGNTTDITNAKDLSKTGGVLTDNSLEFTGSLKLMLDEKAMAAVNKQIAQQTGGMKDGWQDAADAIQAVGSAMSQIEDPAAKVIGTVAQAIATIALTFAKSLSGTVTPWDWIAAAAAGTATMISTIAAIHSATGYANGGIVKGKSYSGDNIFGGAAMVNAGELVLNRAQQGNLASALEGSGTQNLQLSAVVTGEQIRMVLNNNGRRTGRGEYVTTHFQ